jgi:hypothetical protein
MDINLTKKLDTLKQHRKEYNIAQDKLVKSQNSFREDYIPFLLSSIKVTEWTTRFTKNKEGVLLEPVDNKRIEELKYPLLGIVDTEKGYRLPNYPIFLYFKPLGTPSIYFYSQISSSIEDFILNLELGVTNYADTDDKFYY